MENVQLKEIKDIKLLVSTILEKKMKYEVHMSEKDKIEVTQRDGLNLNFKSKEPYIYLKNELIIEQQTMLRGFEYIGFEESWEGTGFTFVRGKLTMTLRVFKEGE